MNRTRLPHTFPALTVVRDNTPGILIVVAVVLLFGWTSARGWDTRLAECLEAYDRAHSAADTARVDATPMNARVWQTCRKDRQDGTLDRYRQSIEAGRAPNRGTAAPFIEK